MPGKSNRLRWIALLLSLLLLTASAGCHGIEPNNQAYVLLIGIDHGENNLLRMSYLIANPQTAAGGGGNSGNGGGGAQESSVMVVVEGPSFFTTTNLINSFVSRRINLPHLKGMIFSEAMARDGSMSRFVAALPVYRELRRDVFIAVSQNKPEEVLAAVKPKLASNPSKYIEELIFSSRFTSISPEELFLDFYTGLSIQGFHPVTNLMAVSDEQLPPESEKQGQWQSEGDYQAGTIIKKGDILVELAGAAAFRSDRMVGFLDIEETRLYNMFRNKFDRGIYSMPDPVIPDNNVLAMMITKSRNPKIKVTMTPEGPLIKVIIYLNGEVLGDTSLVDYARPDNKAVMEEAFTGFMETRARALISRCQNEFGSDILGFGLYARRLVLTDQAWRDFDWDVKFLRAKVDVTVDFHVRRTGLLYKIMPIAIPEQGIREGENKQ